MLFRGLGRCWVGKRRVSLMCIYARKFTRVFGCTSILRCRGIYNLKPDGKSSIIRTWADMFSKSLSVSTLGMLLLRSNDELEQTGNYPVRRQSLELPRSKWDRSFTL